jgi:hypothetical protein
MLFVNCPGGGGEHLTFFNVPICIAAYQLIVLDQAEFVESLHSMKEHDNDHIIPVEAEAELSWIPFTVHY